jgi:predicted small lipoprotein YifL
MRHILKFSTILALIVTLSSCGKDDPIKSDPTIVFRATLGGNNEVPANGSTASGTATLTFNDETKIFTVTVNHSGVTATAAHIHRAAAGTNGGVIFGFSPATSPINFTSPALTATQEAELKAGLYYVNVHSALFPGGEIRGQLIP